MVDKHQPQLRAMRLPRAIHRRSVNGDVSSMPERVSQRSLAPEWVSPTEHNGTATPRAVLHVALIAPNVAEAERIKGRLRVITPPLWRGGKVYLHIIPEDQLQGSGDLDIRIRQALVDLGFADSTDVGIGPPEETTIGYPSGVTP